MITVTFIHLADLNSDDCLNITDYISEGSVSYQHVLWHKYKNMAAILKSHMIKIHKMTFSV